MGYHLAFFLILIGSTIAFSNAAYGLWIPQDPQELLEQSETVFVGTIQSVNVLEFEKSNTYEVEEDGKVRAIVENYTQPLDEYTVSIEEFLKNPLESSTITMLEATVGGVPGRSVSIGGFDTGDRVLFYVPKIDGTNQYSPESFKLPEHCDASSVLEKPRIIGVNDFTTRQNGIQLHDNFTANHPIEFVFHKDMRTLDGKGFETSVGISKVTENQRQIIFEKTIQAESAPCEWIATAAWDVTLDEGKYRMDMHETGDLRANTSSMSINVVADTIEYLPEHIDPDPVLDLWNSHSEIIDGTIVSKTTYPGTGIGPTEFHVKVNKFFKPLSKNTESITLFASYTDSDIPSILNEGDRALIYIESGNQISRYSVKVDGSTYCEPRDYIQISPVLPNDPNQLVRGPPTLDFEWKDQCVAGYFTKDPNFWMYREYKSPLHQWKIHNIPIHEQRCINNDYVSVQKIGNSNYKYCVNDTSVEKLVERGWAQDHLEIDKALSSYMNKIIPTLDDFKSILSEPYDVDMIFSKFGEPHDDIGSGIHIYVYDLNDKTQVWIGYVEDIWYIQHVDADGNLIDELFAKPPEQQPNAFANGVTEIINKDHEPLKYTKTNPSITETFLGKNVSQWQDVSFDDLIAEHEKYPNDEFFTELGRLLIKNEMVNQMENLRIINANDDFNVMDGMHLQSLPPHIGFSTVVNATDGHSYRLEGGTHANQISYYRTTQLAFYDTSQKVPMKDLITTPQVITILPERGNDARAEPWVMIIHKKDSNVEFFNESPYIVRIQDEGTGTIGEEHLLDWMGPTILPSQRASMTFDKVGYYEWDGRKALQDQVGTPKVCIRYA